MGIYNQVRHKPCCTATVDGYRLEILDLGGRGIVLCSVNKCENSKCADQVVFAYARFSYDVAQMGT